MKKGFTLMEFMIAGMVLAIVLTAVMSSFLTTQRMLKESMTESELALATRELREKLLFHVSPEVNGVHYAGLLSGTNATSVVDASSGIVSMNAVAVGSSLGDIQAKSMRLLLSNKSVAGESGSAETRYYLFNDATPDKESHSRWLWPGRMSLCNSSMNDIVGTIRPTAASPMSAAYAMYFDIELKSNVKNNDGTQTTRKERINVPLFSKLQPDGD